MRLRGTMDVGKWVVGLMVVVVGTAFAGPPAPGNIVLREIPYQVRVLVLPSGMRILVEEDHSRPLVAVVAVVDVGAAADPAGKEGLAHLVEHLAFRARQDGKHQMSSLLDFAGVGNWNATTSHDLTEYYSVGPKESLPALLALEGARLLHPVAGVDAKTFDVEREVVRNELHERDENAQVVAVWTKLYAALYPAEHPYSRAVIGSDQSLSALTPGDAEAFVKKHYLPQNITLLISGDLDAQQIGKLLDANFPAQFLDAPPGGKTPGARLPTTAPPVPAPPPRKPLETVSAPADGPTLYIAWSLPRAYDSDSYIQNFLASAVAQEAGGAFRTESDVVGISTFVDRGRQSSTLIVEVQLGEGKNPEKSGERIIDQLINLWEPAPTGLTDVVNKARERRFLRLRGTALVRVAESGEALTTRSQQRAELFHLTGDPRSFTRDLAGLSQLSSAKFERYTYEWLTRDRARMVFVQPSASPRPETDAAGRSLVFGPADENRFVVPPGALQTFVHPLVVDQQSFKLANGLEVLLVRRRTAPTVAVTLAIRGGTATAEPFGVPVFAEYFARPHFPDFGRPSDFGATFTQRAGVDTSYIQFTGASGNLENLLELAAKLIDTLHVDDSIRGWFRTYVAPSLIADEQRFSERAERRFLEAVYAGSSYGKTPLSADLEKLSSSDAQRWIGRVLRPRNAALVIVGDIEFDQAKQMVGDWLGGWSGAADSAPRPVSAPSARPTGTQIVRTDRPGAKQTELSMGCSLPQLPPKDLVALRMLGERMRRRMGEFARSTLGGSYGFQGGATLHREAALIEVSGAVDERALTRALALARKELEELGHLEVPDDEVARLQWRLGIASDVAYQRNSALGSYLAWTRAANLPIDFVEKYPTTLAEVTSADLTRLAAVCARTATLGLLGDPNVVERALKATAR
jgi:zinc protease